MERKKHKVLIIGAGFSGICAAIVLRKKGIHDFVILEKADGLGGTWRYNTYPGAECDIPSALYSYSFEQNPNWSYKWSGQEQILQYQRETAAKYDIEKHFIFNTEVTESKYQEDQPGWQITTSTGKNYQAQHLICAIGQLHHPSIPDICDADRYAGQRFHSARWDHTVDLKGKRIGVIGNAASAVQFIPEIAKDAAQVTIFQRSPNWIVPKVNNPASNLRMWMYRTFPWTAKLARLKTWLLGEFAFFPAIQGNRLARWLLKRKNAKLLASSIKDPELTAALIPDYPVGAKRVLFSDNYYPTLARENVRLETSGIEAFTENGIIQKNGVSSEFDVVIYATGFKTNPFLSPMEFIGEGGKSLRESWSAGAYAYLGLNTNGFPNLFIMYGPNTNLGHNSIILMIEAQARYIVESICTLDKLGRRAMDIKNDVEAKYNSELQGRLRELAFNEVEQSWYKDGDRITNNWAGGTHEYRRRLAKIDWQAYTLH